MPRKLTPIAGVLRLYSGATASAAPTATGRKRGGYSRRRGRSGRGLVGDLRRSHIRRARRGQRKVIGSLNHFRKKTRRDHHLAL